ncbi:hypothetical protein FBEOM_13704 [Fusarium beomiforme]|uniref:Heterokaryon incompatibility domain-containing protein n=1 Tax=Fusarium beomiforme TaxID=44412 RepID=A0A9P5A596_9HYPO|nr:hypothetical protein FBEOM_13704 [Fusarium beomiforme]
MPDVPNKRRRLCASQDLERFEHQTEAASISQDPCSRCSNVAWSSITEELASSLDKFVASDKDSTPDQFVADVDESYQELASSHCQICQLLASLKISSPDTSPCSLRAVSAKWLFMRKQLKKHSDLMDTALLYIVSKEGQGAADNRKHLGDVLAIEPTNERSPFLSPHRIDVKSVDYDRVTDWLHYLQPLDVLDYESREITTLPSNEKYAALSYLWGTGEYKDNEEPPQVIQDSMTCIKQDDPFKGEKLRRMGKIYSEARFTIIDAAGQDPSLGLAGVAMPRQPQAHALTNGIQLSYLCKPPREEIAASPWATRGWTYQEGFLSRRRLFFTKEQVIFQCNNMSCFESFTIPMKALHKRGGSTSVKNPVLRDTEPLLMKRMKILDHLMEYRILSFFKTQNSWYHFLGNPIDPNRKHIIIEWYHLEPAVRRKDFPSWSWTGWGGPLKFTSYHTPDYELRLIPKAGEPVTFDEYIQSCDKPQSLSMEPFIRLTGKMTTITFERLQWSTNTEMSENTSIAKRALRDGAWAVLTIAENLVSYLFLYADDESLRGKAGFNLPVIILETGEQSRGKNMVVLVLRQAEGYYERVGALITRSSLDSCVMPVVNKDASGRWSTSAHLNEADKHLWLDRMKEDSVRLK